ncbi:MAG: aminotransferase [Bryobacterales bacterium]|nr:aminotransferase [Bryobacterales bacterium]
MGTEQPRATTRARFRSDRTASFTESVIREMSRIAARHKAVNLAQGFPDFPAPDVLKAAAIEAIIGDINQYAITWGSKPFRDAIADKYRRHYALELDPESEITVCCGSTEGMMAALLAVTNPGDEVVIFEPYYENYGPDTLLCGASRRFVSLHPPDWSFDPDELRSAFTPRTKAIIINTPNNPTGKVFTRGELALIAELCQEFNALAITDEIYEHIVYDGIEHVPLLTFPGMRDRTILVNSLSKTYSVTGWRVGWVLASPDLTDTIRKVHDFLTVGAAAPLQQAGAVALSLPDSYYAHLAQDYQERRDLLSPVLENAGLKPFRANGAYYVMTDISQFGYLDDVEFVRDLVEKVGVAGVPGSSFFANPRQGANYVRFCFCKRQETIEHARERLSRIGELMRSPAAVSSKG